MGKSGVGHKSGKITKKKKTSIGKGKFTKTRQKGGGTHGSTKSKLYRKKYRGQGK